MLNPERFLLLASVFLLCFQFLLGFDVILDATEHHDSLEVLIVADHGDACVADVVQALRELGVLNVDPNFLVEQEQVQVAQERSDVVFTEVVIATASHDESVADW